MILHFKFVSRRSHSKVLIAAMKIFLVLALAAAASCDKLNKPVYLPPDAAAAGGAGAGLQTPFISPARTENLPGAQNYAQTYAAQNVAQTYEGKNSAAQAQILKYENEINEEGYHYAFEQSDGTKAEQDGRIIPGAPESGSLTVTGSYSYIGDDGQVYTVTYTADEGGYRASGAHLPTPPPVPEAILRSLQLTDATGAHYDSKRSSYDADAGY